MSEVRVFQCDGPSCLETVEDIGNEDDLAGEGWFLLTFRAGEDDADEVAHLHSLECVIAWAQVCDREWTEA